MLKIHHLGPTRSLRIVWQCEEMGLPYEIAGATLPTSAEYRALNPIGSLPFLEDDGGVAISESIAIMLYLATKYGPTPLLPPASDPCYAAALQLTVFGEATLGALGNVLIPAVRLAPAEQKRNWSSLRAADRMKTALEFTAAKLDGREFLAGDRFTLADISVGYAIGVIRLALGEFVETPPALNAYHDRLTARAAYQRAAAK